MTVAVVHLVRKANGPEALAAFLEEYKAHPAGVEHTLWLACKGFGDDDQQPYEAAREILDLPDRGFDLGTYRLAALQLDTDYVCFLNSWSRPLVDGWLHAMMDALQRPGVGLVSCTGSHEGASGVSFPNPHIRTNAFCMRREFF